MTQLKILSADDKLAEIRRLYFSATRQSIEQDLSKALDILKSMASEEERERATVYMEGLAEMRKDWFKPPKARGGTGRVKTGAEKKPASPRKRHKG